VIDIDRYNLAPDLDSYGSLQTNPRSDNNSISGYKIFLPAQYRPLLTVTSLQRNQAGVASADSWETLTAQTGNGGDYIVNLSEATISFVQNAPRMGKRAMRISGTYGSSTVPAEVEQLATLIVAQRILMSSFSVAHNGNWDSVSVADISLSKGGGSSYRSIDTINRDIENMWNVVGTFYTILV
jgi:hypothetical protein